MRQHSLKQRLTVLALLTVAVVWFTASAFTYFNARHEIDEVLDGHLAQQAALLAAQATHELNELEDDHVHLLHKYSRRVAFQIWDAQGTLRLHSENADRQPLATQRSGFSDSVMDGSRWRVFSAQDESGTFLIHVAERVRDREEMARAVVSSLLLPLLGSLPLLAVLLWLAVRQGLQPLDRLAAEVERRDPETLTPLDVGAAPHEVSPLIERLNRLFGRIDSAIQRERRFTADAAHELRTPVAVIKAQVQVARGAREVDGRDRALDNAILGCDRATHLIEQLLTLARVDALDLDVSAPCRLREIAATEIALLAPHALAKGVHIELSEDQEVVVRGNPEWLRILMRNLFDNAVRHTTPGTTVRIGLGHGGGACLSVEDDGPGLSAEDLGRVSERFYRSAETQAGGSGLGLSIVRRIAELHGATLTFTPGAGGRGLCVAVCFPQDAE